MQEEPDKPIVTQAPLIACEITIDGRTDVRVEIRNDLTGNKQLGNYDVRLFQPHSGHQCAFRVEGFDRGKMISELVALALFRWCFVVEFQKAAIPRDDLVYGGLAPELPDNEPRTTDH